MPRRVITVSPAATRSPDAELIALISALASGRGSRTAANRLAFDKEKVADELKQRGIEEEGLVNFFKGADDLSARKFLEEGNLPTLLQQLTQSGDPSGRGVPPTPSVDRAEEGDPEVTNRKVAIADSLPKPLPSTDLTFDPVDNLGLIGERLSLVDLERRDPRTPILPLDRINPNLQNTPEDIAQEVLGEGGLGAVDFGPESRLTPETEEAASNIREGFVDSSQDSSLKDDEVRSITLTKSPTRGPVFDRGIKLPESEKSSMIGLLQSLPGPQLREVLRNPAAASILTTILNRKPLALQILEKAIDKGVGFDHLSIYTDKLGNPFIFDKASRELIPVAGDFGKISKAFGPGLPKAFVEAILANFTLDDVNSGKISTKKMMAAFIKDRGFDPARKMTLDLLKSDSWRAVRQIDIATRNAFTATGLENRNLGDQALIVMFNKLIDPDSVVREGEFDRMGLLRNIIGNVEVFIRKMREEGAGLTNNERTQILEFAMGVRVNTILIGVPDIIEANDIAADLRGFDRRLATPPSIREKITFAKAVELYKAENGTTYMEAAEFVGKALVKIRSRKRGKK